MQINTILFDMDGVLIDSEHCFRECCIKTLLEKYGIHTSHEDFIPFSGMGEEVFIGGVVKRHGGTYITEMKDDCYAYYCEHAHGNVNLFDGVKELIIFLKERGYKLAVASSADRVKVLANLKCISLSPADFGAVITGTEVTAKKPDPEIYIAAAKAVGAPPNKCIVVEDAVSGVKAAKAAGIPCVGVTTFLTAEQLKAAGADFIIEKTTDFAELINGLVK